MKYPDIYQIACQLTPISTATWEEFESHFELLSFKKSSYLLEAEQKSRDFFIVKKGVVRNFFTSEEGREYTKIFRGPGGIVGPYMEVLRNIPSRYFIQAVSPCQVVKFSYTEFEKMMEKYHEWERLGRVISQENFLEKEDREFMMLHMKIDQRYENFLKDFSEFKDEIPQYQVASYLGVTPEALNRHLRS